MEVARWKVYAVLAAIIVMLGAGFASDYVSNGAFGRFLEVVAITLFVLLAAGGVYWFSSSKSNQDQ